MQLEQYSLASQQALRAEYPQQPLRGQVALVTGGMTTFESFSTGG